MDFGDIYEYHKAHGNLVTMVCAFKHYTVPYGVVELGEDGGIAAMREKPELDFLTNTGVYVVEPRVVEEMRDGEKIGFPDVIERYRRRRREGRRLSHQREQLDGHGPAGGAGEDEKKAGESAVEKRGVRRAERASP